MGPTESMLISTSVIWFFWRRQKPCCCALHFINHVFMWTRSGHLTAQTWAFAVAWRAPACLFSRTDLRGAVQHASNYFWLFSFARVRLALPALLEGGFPPPGLAAGCGGISTLPQPAPPSPGQHGALGTPRSHPAGGEGSAFGSCGVWSLKPSAAMGAPSRAVPPIARQWGAFTGLKGGVCRKDTHPPTENTYCLQAKKINNPISLQKN